MDDHIPDLRLCKKRNLKLQLVSPELIKVTSRRTPCIVVININTDYFSNNKKLKYRENIFDQ